MPVITPFGELKLDDSIALQAWLDAHNRRHSLYVPEFKVPGGSLEGPVNGDWMLRHTARHMSIARVIKDEIATAQTQGLAMPGMWQTDQQLSDWHQLHNWLHSRIDRVQRIAGHQARIGHPSRP